jgi:mono/diheme cytochrome c family protein
MRRASLLAGVVAGVLLALTAFVANAEEVRLPPGRDRALVYGKCRTCHDLQYLKESAGVPRSTWKDLLDSMKQYGLEISQADREKILDYLGTYLGPHPPTATEAQLPSGPDRTLVYGKCRTCHDVQYLLETAGVPRSTWNDLLDSMKQYGLVVTLDERAKILDYLSTYLGPNPPTAQEELLPPGPNRALVYGKCRTCHDLQYLKESAGVPRSTWNDLLDSMKQYGLEIPKDERAKILDYLATYLGPNPPKQLVSSAHATTAEIDGSAVFAEQCSSCHQPNGKGLPGNFPPLAGNPDLFLSREFPAMVALFGMEGTIATEGQTITSAMPSFGHLSDEEIAAVLQHVRGAWGNDKLRPAGWMPIDAKAVAEVRKKNLTSAQVHAERATLKAAKK